jgi:hypothetical protein
LNFIAPPTRREVMNLLKNIIPVPPIKDLTTQSFATEEDVYNLVKSYYEVFTYSKEQINNWMGKDGSWGYAKRKMVEGERKSGRTVNVVVKE